MLGSLFVALTALAQPGSGQLSAQAANLPPVRAQADISQFVSDADYPAEALIRNEQGTVRFELSVAPDGDVTGCRVVGSSGSSALDEATCSIMTSRARFTPARDSAGAPVADRVAARLNWALPSGAERRARPVRNLASYVSANDYPEDALLRGEQGAVQFRVDVDAGGRATHCHIMVSSGSNQLDLRTCQVAVLRARYEPARDAQGNPVPDTISATIRWVL